MIRSKQNKECIRAVVAIGRAYARMPGVEPQKIHTVAARIDSAIKDEQQAASICALVVLLLRGLGATDPYDISRLMN